MATLVERGPGTPLDNISAALTVSGCPLLLLGCVSPSAP